MSASTGSATTAGTAAADPPARPGPDAAGLLARDRAHVWHPYAAVPDSGPLSAVTDAQGVRLRLADEAGRERWVIDAMSSWWCMIHGYRNPVLDEALHRQVDQFSHVMFGGLTHEGAVDLAETLLALAPDGMSRVFLADSGSVAVEVALKMARQYQISRAHRVGSRLTRTRIAALRGGYHGDTLGAMSVCDPVTGMHAHFADSMPHELFLPRPPRMGAPREELERWAEEARGLLHAHRDVLAGVIVEPVLQGAGGMWTYDPAALTLLREETRALDLVLIADEIATGFGRTGRLFGCDWAEVVPDIITVGKSMTGGYLTQSAVLTGEDLAREISSGPQGALMHGPTFMANPLACAVSRASLGLIGTGRWQPAVTRIEAGLAAGTARLAESPIVADVRVLGATAAVELTRPVDLRVATRAALDAGVWLRPFGRTVYAMPPYVTSREDIATICAALGAVVSAEEAR